MLKCIYELQEYDIYYITTGPSKGHRTVSL